jgi:hypothetical protein
VTGDRARDEVPDYAQYERRESTEDNAVQEGTEIKGKGGVHAALSFLFVTRAQYSCASRINSGSVRWHSAQWNVRSSSVSGFRHFGLAHRLTGSHLGRWLAWLHPASVANHENAGHETPS